MAPYSRAGKYLITFANASIGKLNAGKVALCSVFCLHLLCISVAESFAFVLSSEPPSIPLPLLPSSLAASLAHFLFSARCLASRRLCSRSSFVLAMVIQGKWKKKNIANGQCWVGETRVDNSTWKLMVGTFVLQNHLPILTSTL